MITLIVGLPQSNDDRRSSEYDLCLSRNVENTSFGRVILLEEEAGRRTPDEWSGRPNVTTIKIGKRARYCDYLDIANQQKGVVVMANADVHFDWSARKLAATPEKTILAITRTDMINNLYSSDAWAFRPELKLRGCGWHLGRWHCENAFLEQVRRQIQWRILNPCHEVRLVHVHGSQVYSVNHGKNVKVKQPVTPRPVFFNHSTMSFYEPNRPVN
jgi:hypothetical protein